MKRIIYGVQGEGLGHASRAFSIIEELKNEYEVHVFTSKDAYIFFQKLDYPYLHKIPCVDFSYSNGKVNYLKSSFKIFNFIYQYLKQKKSIKEKIIKINPVISITDFEPIIPKLSPVPCISIDNQHKFTHCSLSGLPIKLKFYSILMGIFIKNYIKNQKDIIISTFHYDKEKTTTKITNVFIRKFLKKLSPIKGDYVLVYYKPIMEKIINILSKTNLKIRVYGKFENYYVKDNVEYLPLSYEKFSKDLSECKALFCTAGNQLLGEARYFGKPIFAIPITNQYEQYVNAFYVKDLGIGTYSKIENIDEKVVFNFLNNLNYYEPHNIDGTEFAIDIIKGHIKCKKEK